MSASVTAVSQVPSISRGSDAEMASASVVLVGMDINDPGCRSLRSGSSPDDNNVVREHDDFMNEAFRAGGPYLCSVPTNTFQIPQNHYLYVPLVLDRDRFIDYTLAILMEHGILCYEFHICLRQSKYSPEISPIPTVFVLAKKPEDTTTRTWIDASREIREVLINHNVEGVSVEIADERAFELPYIFPVCGDDVIVPVWDSLCAAILGAFDEHRYWNSLGCYRIGSSETWIGNAVTVLLMVNRDSSKNWKPTRDRIVDVLRAFNLANVAVSIVKDEMVRSGGGALPIADSVCDGNVVVGQSIGIRGTQSLGTFGGYLQLFNQATNKWEPFGVTCFHCIDPKDCNINPDNEKHFENWRENGVSPGDVTADKLLLMDSPCLRDLKDKVEHLEQLLKDSMNFPIYRDAEVQLAEGVELDERTARHHGAQMKRINDCRAEKARVDKFRAMDQHHLGSAFAASGYKETGQRSILDWALIKVPEDRLGDNSIDLPVIWLLHVNRLTDLPEYPNNDPMSPKYKRVEKYHQPGSDRNEILYKNGRMTGYTSGRWNGVATCNITTRIVDGKEITVKTKEHTICAEDGKRFSEEGDSGSLVFNMLGQVIGLLFGGTQQYPISYFSHIDDVYRDITAVTGAKVRLAL